jgi:hypothetical protein
MTSARPPLYASIPKLVTVLSTVIRMLKGEPRSHTTIPYGGFRFLFADCTHSLIEFTRYSMARIDIGKSGTKKRKAKRAQLKVSKKQPVSGERRGQANLRQVPAEACSTSS